MNNVGRQQPTSMSLLVTESIYWEVTGRWYNPYIYSAVLDKEQENLCSNVHQNLYLATNIADTLPCLYNKVVI